MESSSGHKKLCHGKGLADIVVELQCAVINIFRQRCRHAVRPGHACNAFGACNVIVVGHKGKIARRVNAVLQHHLCGEVEVFRRARRALLFPDALFVHTVRREPARHALRLGDVLTRTLSAGADDGKLRLVGDIAERRIKPRPKHQRRLGTVHARAENNDAGDVLSVRVRIVVPENKRLHHGEKQGTRRKQNEQNAFAPRSRRLLRGKPVQKRIDDHNDRRAPEKIAAKAHAGDRAQHGAQNGKHGGERPKQPLSFHSFSPKRKRYSLLISEQQ